MSALLGMQDGNSISLHVISFGNIFLPFLFVVTLRMLKKYVRIMFYAYTFSIWGILITEINRLCSHCAESLGIEFSLKELRAVCWQIIGVHKLFSRSFVRCLKGKKQHLSILVIIFINAGFGLTSNDDFFFKENASLHCPAVLCCSEPKPCSWHQFCL